MPADELGKKQFYIGEAAEAAGIDTNTCRSWLKRGNIVLSPEDREAAGAGRPQLLSLRRVLQIAITAELVKIGMTPASAAKAAIPFTDFGEEVSGWTGDPDSTDTRGVREPGGLLQDSLGTLLAVKANGDVRVMPADSNEVFVEVYTRSPVAFLHLDPLVHRVRRALSADK